MQASHHRKIELQSPADLSYLYSNTLAFSKEKLAQHFPPSNEKAQNGDTGSDPLENRVRELVEDVCRCPLLSLSILTVST